MVCRRECIRHSKNGQTQGKGGMNRLSPVSMCPAVSPKGVPSMHTFRRMTQATTKGQIYSGRVLIGDLFYEPEIKAIEANQPSRHAVSDVEPGTCRD